jgi:hypothetical protein
MSRCRLGTAPRTVGSCGSLRERRADVERAVVGCADECQVPGWVERERRLAVEEIRGRPSGGRGRGEEDESRASKVLGGGAVWMQDDSAWTGNVDDDRFAGVDVRQLQLEGAGDDLPDVTVCVGRSLSRQLEEQMRSAIQSEAFAAGSQLPSTRVLAQDLGVSRGVIVRAYAQLAAEGYLALRQGAAVTVRATIRVDPKTAREPNGGPRVAYDLRPHPS